MSGSQSTRAVWSAVTVGPNASGHAESANLQRRDPVVDRSSGRLAAPAKKHNPTRNSPLCLAEQARNAFASSLHRKCPAREIVWRRIGRAVVSQNLLSRAIYVNACERSLRPLPGGDRHLDRPPAQTAVIEISFDMVLGFAASPSSDCNWGASKSLPKLDARWRKIARRSIPTTH